MAEVNEWMIDPADAVMLLIDHQSGLFRALMESYEKAQSVQKIGRETALDRLESVPAKR